MNTQNTSVINSDFPFIDASGNVKSIFSKNNVLVGGWIALMLASTLSYGGYSVSTSLFYPNQDSQSVLEYQPGVYELSFEEDIRSDLFLEISPKRIYTAKLKIVKHTIGQPV